MLISLCLRCSCLSLLIFSFISFYFDQCLFFLHILELYSFLTVKEVDTKYNLLMLSIMDKFDFLRRQSWHSSETRAMQRLLKAFEEGKHISVFPKWDFPFSQVLTWEEAVALVLRNSSSWQSPSLVRKELNHCTVWPRVVQINCLWFSAVNHCLCSKRILL